MDQGVPLAVQLRRLLLWHGGSIALNQFLEAWHQFYGFPFNPQQYGRQDLVQVLSTMPLACQINTTQHGHFQPHTVTAVVNPQVLQQLVTYVRWQMTSAGKCVKYDVVLSQVVEMLGGRSFEELGLPMPQDFYPLRELKVLDRRVDVLVTCFIAGRGIATLYELEQLICESEGISSYDELGLGPLLAHPWVQRVFKPDAALRAVPKVTSEDVVKVLCSLMRRMSERNPLERWEKVVAQELLKQKSVRHLGELCVQISDLTQYAEQLKKGVAAEHKSLVSFLLKEEYADIGSSDAAGRDESGQTFARCAVCARARKGRCGTETAPMRCLSRRHNGLSWKDEHGEIHPAAGVPTSNQAAAADVVDLTQDSKSTGGLRAPGPSLEGLRAENALLSKPRNTSDSLLKFDEGAVRTVVDIKQDVYKLTLSEFLNLPKTFAFKDLLAHFVYTTQRLVKGSESVATESGLGEEDINRSVISNIGRALAETYSAAAIPSGKRKTKAAHRRKRVAQFWEQDVLAQLLVTSLYLSLNNKLPQAPANLTSASDLPVNVQAALQRAGTNQTAHSFDGSDSELEYLVSDSDDSDAGDDYRRELTDGTVRSICNLIVGLQKTLSKSKPRSHPWRPDMLKELRSRVQSGLAYSPEKLKALAVFLDFVLERKREQAAVDDEGGAGPTSEVEQATGGGEEAGGIVGARPGVLKRPALHVTLIQLREAVVKFGAGTTLPSLTALEQALCTHFGASAIEQLVVDGDVGSAKGVSGPSLVALLAALPEVMELVAGPGNQGGESGCAPQSEVLDLVAQVLLALEVEKGKAMQVDLDVERQEQTVVSRVLCLHYRVPAVLCLGHGSVQHLIRQVRAGGMASSGCFRNVLALLGSGVPQPPGAVGLLGEVDVDAARRALRSAPDLADLQLWSQWQHLFEPSFGSLEGFLRREGPALGVAALALPPHSSPGLVLPHGRLIKVRPHANMEEWVEAINKADATGAAAVLLSLVALGGSLGAAPLALMASHCQACLKAMAVQAGQRSDVEVVDVDVLLHSASSRGQVARFVLAVTTLLPLPMQPVLASKVLLDPMAQVFGGVVHRELLDSAVTPLERATLHHLGWALGVALWQEDWQAATRSRHGAETVPAGGRGDSGDGAGGGTAMEVEVQGSSTAAAAGADVPLQALLQRLRQREATAEQGVAMDEGGQPAEVSSEAVDQGSVGQQAEGAGAELAVVSACKLVVEAIRRDEFGLGLSLSGEGNALRERQNARMGRALQRLSQELYSRDTHFVLELVQNADDNTYPSGVLPALEFVLLDDCVVVLNNEVGFGEPNVRALCDVGRSTKTKVSGYIGQKGIGFKSVFRVTDAPEIHSNGYHLSFNLQQHKALGYILPTWLDKQGAGGGAASRLGLSPQRSTCIVLPLKPELRGERSTVLRQKFEDVQPTLLLFLQRLQCIAVTDAVSKRSMVMGRRVVSPGVIELRSGESGQDSSTWMMVEARFAPRLPRLDVTINETQVSLAFALDGSTPGQQQVYAFLPLRSYGLRFVIQADFVVPSSRESVDCDNPWNEMLRAELPALFLKALPAFQALPPPADASPKYWTDRWLRCVPLDGEAQGFFAGLPHSIAARLRPAPCIPTELGDMVPPSEVLVCNNPAIRALLACQDLAGLLGLHFAHPDLEVLHSSAPLRQLLGVREFAPQQLLDLMKVVCNTGRLQGLGLPWLSQLLICVFELLEAGPGLAPAASLSRASILQQLRQLPILPLRDGLFASCVEVSGAADPPADQQPAHSAATIYFPLNINLNLGEKSGGAAQGVVAAAPSSRRSSSSSSTAAVLRQAGISESELGLQFLNGELLSHVAAEDKRQLLVKGLKDLGVCKLEVTDVFWRYVVPLMTRAAHAPASSDAASAACLTSALAFPLLAGIIPSKAAATKALEVSVVAALRQHCMLLLASGNRLLASCSEPCYFPTSMDNSVDVAREFEVMSWNVLSDIYVTQFPGLKQNWRWLFQQLGVTDLPPLQQRVVTLTPADLADSAWAALAPAASSSAAGEAGAASAGTRLPPLPPGCSAWRLDDWVCPHVEALVSLIKKKGSGSKTAMKLVERLLALLARHWAHFSRGLSALPTPVSQDGSAAAHSCDAAAAVPSSLALVLRNTAWLPSRKGTLHIGSDMYVTDSGGMTALLSDHLNVYSGDTSSAALLADLGVKSRLDAATLLDIMRGWAASSAADNKAGRAFEDSSATMAAIYEYLSRAMAEDSALELQVCAAFAAHPLVWLPVPGKGDWSSSSTATLPGRFYACKALRWQDPCDGVVEELATRCNMRILAHHYPQRCHHFFIEQLLALPTTAPPASDDGGTEARPALILEVPSTQDYCELLKAVAAEPLVTPRQYDQVLCVYGLWAADWADGVLSESALAVLVDQLRAAGRVLPTTRQRWVGLSDDVLIDDEPMLSTRLSSHAAVHFLKLPKVRKDGSRGRGGEVSEGERDQLVALFQALGVKMLSSAVQRQVSAGPAVEVGDAEFALDALVRACIPYVQRYLWHSLSLERYRELSQLITPLLADLSVKFVKGLALEVGLPLSSGTTASSGLVRVVVALAGSTLYVASGSEQSYDDIAHELSRLFSGGAVLAELADFLFTLMLTRSSKQSLEGLMARRRVAALPLGEAVWKVPPPTPKAAPPPKPVVAVSAAAPSGAQRGDAPGGPDAAAHAAKGGPRQPATATSSDLPQPPSSSSRPRDSLPSEDQPTAKRSRTDAAGGGDEGAAARLDASQVEAAAEGRQWEPGELQERLEGGAAAGAREAGLEAMGQGAQHEYGQHVDGGGYLQRDAHAAYHDQRHDYPLPPSLPAPQDHDPYLHRHPPLHRPAYLRNQASFGDSVYNFQGGAGPTTGYRPSLPQQRTYRRFDPRPREYPLPPPQGGFPLPDMPPPPPFGGPGGRAPGAPRRWQPRLAAADAAHAVLEVELPTTVLDRVGAAAAQLAAFSMRGHGGSGRGGFGGGGPGEERLQVGRCGEELVWHYLQQQAVLSGVEEGELSEGQQAVSRQHTVVWINRQEESGYPYDLYIQSPDGSTTYVEVKSSSSRSKDMFEVSYRELQFAAQHGDAYVIYRVSGIGSEQPRLLRLVNPIQLWSQGDISVAMVV